MTLLATLACLLPLLVGGSVLLSTPNRRTGGAARVAVAFAGLSFAATLLCAGLVLLAGPSDVTAWGLSLKLDTVAAVFGLVIGFVGLAIVQFSVGYLSGEKRQRTFMGLLLLTLFFAQLLAMAGDVFLFGLAWVGMSLPVQKLLIYYPRPGAVLAARLKFGFARISDLALFAALGLLVAGTGSTGIAAIGAAADTSTPVVIAAVFLAIAILLRSAQVPTHAWLLRAVEAPTPVSAVLHAGVVNAGGLVALRFAPVLSGSPVAMTLLALVSGFSMLVALGAMSGDQRLKSRLAWSTVAQMGFMLIQCSLGLFGLALLHIAAHALYKSFTFLNAGTLAPVRPPAAPSWGGAFVAVAAFATVVAVASPWVGLDAASLLIGAIFVLGLGVLGAGAGTASGLLFRFVASAAATVLWLGLHEIAVHILPAAPAQWTALTVVGATVGTAVLATLISHSPLRDRPAIKALRLHIRNGLYIDLFIERLAEGRVATPHSETAK